MKKLNCGGDKMSFDNISGNGNSFLLRMLDKVECAGNKLPDPSTLFLIFTIVVMVISAVCSYANVSVTYDMITAAQGETVTKTVDVVNLLSRDSLVTS